MIIEKLRAIWGIEKKFRLKVLLITNMFSLLVGCDAIWRPLKTSIFTTMVGEDFIPNVRLFSLIPLVILITLYSYLVDRLKRHQLVYVFAAFHAVLGIILFYFLQHPVYGIANTDQNPYRIVGWCFYFFMESFSAFMTTVFWSFADSIHTPDEGKRFYGFFTAGSKIGGMLSAGFLLATATFSTQTPAKFIPLCFLVGNVMLLCAMGIVFILKRTVPKELLFGYKPAVKKLETGKGSFKHTIKNAFDGLLIMLKKPYVFGIFSLIVFYDVIIVIFDFLVIKSAVKLNGTIQALTSYYALLHFSLHAIGLVVAVVGTVPLQRALGIRYALFIYPIFLITALTTTLFFPNAYVLFLLVIFLKAVNYAVHHPTREVLYIPTTRAIKFKAKAWTDAFGSRMSKGLGSLFNLSAKALPLHVFTRISTLLSIGIGFSWLLVAYVLGNTCQHAIDNKKVIGEDE